MGAPVSDEAFEAAVDGAEHYLQTHQELCKALAEVLRTSESAERGPLLHAFWW